MKLNVDLELLNNAVKKMGAPLVEFNANTSFEHLDILGTTMGREIDIKDIEINLESGSLFEFKGRQVLLFIPNQFNELNLILENATKGNRFHIADCSTLIQMKETNRYNKYAVTNNLSGKFTIYHRSNTNEKVESKLYVCKNCLEKLNYKNYKDESTRNRNQIFSDFKINEFFETYSTFFNYLPNIKNNEEILNRNPSTIIKKKNYVCETCNTDFKNNSKLIVNDNKKRVICVDCYRKVKDHKTTFITNPELKEIYKERTKQNKSIIQNWDDVYKYTDISIHGYIHRLKRSYKPPTYIGYILPTNENIILDMVWITEKKKSALVTKKTEEHNKLTDWNIVTLGEAMEKLKQR